MKIEFTLVMCVYSKESPDFLSKCLDSILTQTVLPDEIVVVKDGPLSVELDTVIDTISYPNELNIIALPENVTLGPARAIGVQNAKYDWIAIMDSDDLCSSDRFAKQLQMINDNPQLGLIGGQISEFSDEPSNIVAAREVPVKHEDIAKFIKKRNPFNHMTVMFNRTAVMDAGNYRLFPWFEDYDLWSRMISNGVICENHNDVLVYARVGSGMYERRRGINYIRSELRMQKQLVELKMINVFEYARNVLIRVPVRLLPSRWLAKVYNYYVRK